MSRFRSFASIRDFLKKSAPASHVTSFVILHELTAVVPLPIIYYTLQTTGLQVPVPQDVLEESEKRMEKLFKRYGWIDADTSASLTTASDGGDATAIQPKKMRMLVDMATSYAVVKVLMPARLAASLALTPWFARRAIVPIRDKIKRMLTKGPMSPTA
ncbi:hypothetical protein BC830DRAFT_1097004 [Chytriomyces sp. MP71]|nr:hypothetical protein BC830DRAFT_1097004 [Chytriomyces sp. MP71]